MYIIEDKRAPNPRRVRVFVAEKGIEVEYRQIDMNKGEHLTPEIAEKNPLQRFPILVLDDGTAISESIAICRYFEEMHPEPSLFGLTPVEKAKVEMWSRRAELNFLSQVAQAFRHTHPAMATMEVPQVAEWGEANREKIDKTLVHFDNALKEARFVAGQNYSVADITLLIGIDFMRVLKRRIPDEMTALQDWHKRVSERESAQA